MISADDLWCDSRPLHNTILEVHEATEYVARDEPNRVTKIGKRGQSWAIKNCLNPSYKHDGYDFEN